MISPKFILLGLSGSGIVAGGLAAWRLTGETQSKFVPSQEQTSQKNWQIKTECGEDIWSDTNDPEQYKNKNSEGKNFHEHATCNVQE